MSFQAHRFVKALFSFCGLSLLVHLCGCASADSNPPKPRPAYGYLDIISPTNEVLYLEAKSQAATDEKFTTLYSRLKGAPGGVLRLALPAGEHRLRIAVLNAATEAPAEVDLLVLEAKVIPIRVAFKAGAEGTVTTREVTVRSGLRGFGRNTTLRAEQDTIYSLELTVQPPVDYQSKQFMPYFNAH